MAKPWTAPDPAVPAGEAVYEQLAADFPPEAISWVRDAAWAGPALVPLDDIDFRGEEDWAAAREPGKVDRFAERIARRRAKGKPVKPVVLIDVPGRDRLFIVDGHHRVLACRQLSEPADAWIGVLSSAPDIEDAEDAHEAQKAGYTLNPRSGMISLNLPPGVIPVVPGGVTDHHITIVYLGPDIDDAAFARACDRAAEGAAALSGPLYGAVGALGAFPPSPGSDGKIPVFARADIPGAEVLRRKLADLSASEHADWQPHVTLTYLTAGDPLPAEPEPVTVSFAHLAVHRGADVACFPLGRLAKTMTPADYQIGQAAAEHATQLAGRLAAAVNAGMIAHGWLNRHKPRRRNRRSTTASPPPAPQQQSAPRQYLHAAGVSAALAAVLRAVLTDLWLLAWLMGVSAAAAQLGLAVIPDDAQALAALEGGAGQRLDGILETRLRRLERILDRALAEDWDPERLAAEIRVILGSIAAALLITITEAQWAAQQATLWAYALAGVTRVSWVTMRDDRVCARCTAAQAAGPWPLGAPFPGTAVPAPPAHPRCRCRLQPERTPARANPAAVLPALQRQ